MENCIYLSVIRDINGEYEEICTLKEKYAKCLYCNEYEI